MSGSGNVYAYNTVKLLQIIAGLPEEEFRAIVSRVLESDESSTIAFYWAVFNKLVFDWAMFEEECRGRGRCNNEYLPEGVSPRRASSFFNDEVRRVVVNACLDLAPDWLVPGWIKWVAGRLGIDLSRLRKLEWHELLARLADYTVYVYGLHGLTRGYLEFFQSEGMEYALVIASHAHWEIVEAIMEPVYAALEPIRDYVDDVAENVSQEAFQAACRFAGSGGNTKLGLLEVASRASTELKHRFVKLAKSRRG